MILRFLFYVFLIYLGYKLLFDFIIPVYRTTKKVKRGFREMQERMQQGPEQYQQNKSPEKNENDKARTGEYIDFEEIK